MALYKLVYHSDGVQRTADGAFIPPDARNVDWKAYQDWLAIPNTPDPADVPPTFTPQQIATALLNSPEPTAVVLRGLIQLLATRFSLTPTAVLTAIVNAAN